MFCTSPINSEIPFIFTDAAIPFLPGEGGLSNGEDFPQQPAPVLIGPNSKLFGSKLNATNLRKPASRWLFLYLPQTPVLARVLAVLLCSVRRRRGRFLLIFAPQTSLFSV